MAKTETIKKDKDVLSNHIKTIRNLIGSERFADDLIEFLDTYSAGNHTLLNEAVFDIAGKHDIIFDDDGNLDEEYADSYHASTKKSKMKKSKPNWEQFMGELNGAVDDVLKDFDLFTLDFRVNTRGTPPFNPAFLEDVHDDFDLMYNGYEASTKKSKIDKTGTIVDVNPNDLTVSIGFWSAGLQSIDKDERLDVHVSLDIGDEWESPPLEASWETRIPISELISPELIQEFKQEGADIITKQVIQYNSRYRREYGGSDDLYTLYYASTKKSKTNKSKSFNEMIKEQRKQYKNKKVV